MARKQTVSPPEVGAGAPEFNLPAAQGGQLRLGLRIVRGPVVVVFYRGGWSEECVEYFKALAEREREINVAGARLVGIGCVEPGEAREFARLTGFKSYVLYDYLRSATRDYGLLQRDPDHGDTARPAAFLIGADHEVLRAWLDERPDPTGLLAEVSGITGLPKEPEEEEEKPKKRPEKPEKPENAAKSSDGEARAEGATDESKPSPETPGNRRDKQDEQGKQDEQKNAREDQGKPEGDGEVSQESGVPQNDAEQGGGPESGEER